MILQSLNQLYDRLKKEPEYEISAPGFSLQGIGFKVVIRPDGSLVDIQDVRVEECDPKGKKAKLKMRQMQVLGSNKPSGSGLNASFLWDTAGYLLGYGPKEQTEKEKKRTLDSFKAFKEMHLNLEKEVNVPEFSAVCRFLEQWNPEHAANYPILNELVGGYGIFQILNEISYVHEHEKIQEFFLNHNNTSDSDAVMGQCLITGETVPIARLQALIKGIGEKPAALVGFNDPAYEAYGKKQAFNAPVGEDSAFRYSVALNALTNGPMKSLHSQTVGDMKVVYWAEKADDSEFIFSAQFGGIEESSLDEATRRKLELFFEAIRNAQLPGKCLNLEKDNHFYVLGLSTNVTRVVVRFFHRSTVEELAKHFFRHFTDMRLEKSFESDREFPSIRLILDQTCILKGAFPDRKQIPSNMEGSLFYAILNGTDYPVGVYNRILQRFKRDHYQDYVKLSFIKAFLIRNHNKELKMSLDTENQDPAYLCGRLFAVFEKTQKDAIDNIKNTIRDSYYCSASSSPGAVFPRLIRNFMHHLSALEFEGTKTERSKLVQEIMDKLGPSYPLKLDLQSQGVFSIAYFQQMQDLYRKKETEKNQTNNK